MSNVQVPYWTTTTSWAHNLCKLKFDLGIWSVCEQVMDINLVGLDLDSFGLNFWYLEFFICIHFWVTDLILNYVGFGHRKRIILNDVTLQPNDELIQSHLLHSIILAIRSAK